jgi:hypothetical protein
LPKEYKWECQGAKRGKKKGRPAGGIITRVKLGIKEKRQKKDEDNNKRFRRYNKRKLYAFGRIGEKAQNIGKRKGGMGKENPKTRWKMQRGRD